MNKSLPNILTLARIALIPLLIVAMAFSNDYGYIISFLIFVAAGVTDWLDGYLARSLNAQSDFGRMMDPVADKLIVATALVILAEQNRVDALPAVAIICREILVSGLREYLADMKIKLPVTRLAKWKTAIQVTAISTLLLAPAMPLQEFFLQLADISIWIAALLTLITGYAYLREGIRNV